MGLRRACNASVEVDSSAVGGRGKAASHVHFSRNSLRRVSRAHGS